MHWNESPGDRLFFILCIRQTEIQQLNEGDNQMQTRNKGRYFKCPNLIIDQENPVTCGVNQKQYATSEGSSFSFY